jgi:hypothetical protein
LEEGGLDVLFVNGHFAFFSAVDFEAFYAQVGEYL